MTYDEWLKLISKLEKTSHEEDIIRFKNEPINPNINRLLVPKIKDMIMDKLNHNIDRIVKELDIVFADENELDLALVTLKKNIKIILSLIDNKQLDFETKVNIRSQIEDSVNSAYDVLYKAAYDASEDGVFNSIINKNRIKWSDYNELRGN